MKAETFQDPSVQMKRALLRPMAVGLVIMVLCMICALPGEAFLKSIFGLEPQRELPQVHDERDSNRIKAQEDEIVQRHLDALMAQRQVYLNSLLEPSLGSYGTAAGALLKPIAEDVGLTISVDSVDLPMRRLPLPLPPRSPQLYARKPIRLTCTGSYMRIISFLQCVEKQLPLVSLEAFSLKMQRDPDNQLATIVLEWPVRGERMDEALIPQGARRPRQMDAVCKVQAELEQLTMYKNGRRTYGRLLVKIAEIVPEGIQLMALEIPEPPVQNLLPPGAKPGPKVKPLLGPTNTVEDVTLCIMGRAKNEKPVKAMMEALSSPTFADSLIAAQKGADVGASRQVRSWPDTSSNGHNQDLLAFEIKYRCVERRFEK